MITNLPLCLIEEQPLQAQQGADHVFADSLCFSLGCSPDLTVDVESCVAPAENLLHKGMADELLLKQQGEDVMGEESLDTLITEAGNLMKRALPRSPNSGCGDGS